MHRWVHPGHLPPCHPADAAGDGRHHRLRHWQGDVIISQKKRRPGRESPSGPAQSQHFQRTVLYYRLFSNSANIFRLRTIYVPIFRPVRSAPHSRMGHGLVREERQKQTAPKSSQKWKNRANHMDLHGCVMCWEKRYPFSVKYNFRYSVINLSFLGVILPVFFLRLGFQPRKPR